MIKIASRSWCNALLYAHSDSFVDVTVQRILLEVNRTRARKVSCATVLCLINIDFLVLYYAVLQYFCCVVHYCVVIINNTMYSIT